VQSNLNCEVVKHAEYIFVENTGSGCRAWSSP
jgi:hypothetical protein